VPLDHDVNEAISAYISVRHCHSGRTRCRSKPRDWRLPKTGSFSEWLRRCDEGVGTAADITAKKELIDLLDQHWEADEGRFPYSTEDRVDSIFLLVAIRTVLTMAERIVEQLKLLGKEAEAARARNAFTSRFAIIRDLRDIALHYDAYAIECGKHQHLSLDPTKD
jgi:hypothetical protein